MKHLKRMTALALAILLVLSLFSGCGSKNPPETEENTADLTFYFYDSYMRADKTQNIEAYARNLVKEALGAEVDICWIAPRDWTNTVQLDIASGEQVDVVCLPPEANIAMLAGAGMLTNLSGFLPAQAPEAYALMEEFLPCYTFDGALYGLPTMKDFTESRYLVFNASILDECRLRKKAVTLSNLDQVEILFTEITAREENTAWAFGAAEGLWDAGFLTGLASFADHTAYDDLSDPLGLACYRDGAVTCVAEDEQFALACARVAKWNENGWLWPDSANTIEDHSDLLRRGAIFCTAVTDVAGLAEQTAESPTMVAVKLAEDPITTADLTRWGVGVASTCENPELACRFIELLYTNSDLLMALVRGIEREDYLDTGGNVLLTGGYVQDDSVVGNQFLLVPLSGSDPEHYKQVAARNAAAQRSEALGFCLDTDSLTEELTRLMSVQDRYHQRLVCGGYTEALYEEYLAALSEAGIGDYLDAVQKQLDAFLAQ